jgi:hypothetical protein
MGTKAYNALDDEMFLSRGYLTLLKGGRFGGALSGSCGTISYFISVALV